MTAKAFFLLLKIQLHFGEKIVEHLQSQSQKPLIVGKYKITIEEIK